MEPVFLTDTGTR